MAKKKKETIDIVLNGELHGKEVKTAGNVVKMEAKEARKLIQLGMARLPDGDTNKPSDNSDALKKRVKDLEADLKAAQKENKLLQEGCESKLDQARAYALYLEDKCRAAGLSIEEQTPEAPEPNTETEAAKTETEPAKGKAK